MASSASFAILLILAAAMATPQTTSAYSTQGFNLVKCWEAISHFDICLPKVIVPEALNIEVKVTIECCQVLEEIKDNCIPHFKPILPFAPNAMFDQICGHFSAPAPALAPATNA